MLKGERVTIRAIQRQDLERIWLFNNDLEVELAGGGDPPVPQSIERLFADFDRESATGGRDGAWFAVEADGIVIGQCGLMHPNETAGTCELGIAIGDKACWGKGYGKESVSLRCLRVSIAQLPTSVVVGPRRQHSRTASLFCLRFQRRGSSSRACVEQRQLR